VNLCTWWGRLLCREVKLLPYGFMQPHEHRDLTISRRYRMAQEIIEVVTVAVSFKRVFLQSVLSSTTASSNHNDPHIVLGEWRWRWRWRIQPETRSAVPLSISGNWYHWRASVAWLPSAVATIALVLLYSSIDRHTLLGAVGHGRTAVFACLFNYMMCRCH
jgi:hypothetical protein